MLNGIFSFPPRSCFLGQLSIHKILVLMWGKSKAQVLCPVDRSVLEGVKRGRKDFICFWGKVAGHDSVAGWNCGEKRCQRPIFAPHCSAMPTATGESRL